MILVGLTGGVATGKSTIAKIFKSCGAVLIDADELAREVVQAGKPAWREIVKTFGRSVLNPDHTINRHALGAIVFDHPAQRRALERIIHPRVARRQATLTQEAARKNPKAVVVYEVPLLFEAGVDKRVDKIIVVATDRETQIARLKRRNGLTRSEALRRIRSQMPLKQKIKRADYVLDGTMNKRVLARRVARIFLPLQTSDNR